MQRRPLGDSGLQVTPLGLGLAALGRPGYINLGHGADYAEGRDVGTMRSRAFEVLDAAWALGLRYLDAARSYGLAEAFLGDWLRARGIDRAAFTLGSKWGYRYTAGWRVEAERHEVKEHSLAVLRRQWGESREALGGPPDLYQIHSATPDSGVLDNGEVLDELARLKTGHDLRIGLTLSGADQAEVLARALRIERDGRRLFDAVQATWNLLEPSAGPALASARAEGMGVIVKEALANGRLTGRNSGPGFAGRLALLQAQARRLHTTVDALALAAVLAQPWADVCLCGAATSGQLDSNLRALAVAWDDEAAETLAALAEPAADYWATRSALAWN